MTINCPYALKVDNSSFITSCFRRCRKRDEKCMVVNLRIGRSLRLADGYTVYDRFCKICWALFCAFSGLLFSLVSIIRSTGQPRLLLLLSFLLLLFFFFFLSSSQLSKMDSENFGESYPLTAGKFASYSIKKKRFIGRFCGSGMSP